MNFIDSIVNSFGVSKLDETVLTTDSVPDPDEFDLLENKPYQVMGIIKNKSSNDSPKKLFKSLYEK